jgi:hypothetical protein
MKLAPRIAVIAASMVITVLIVIRILNVTQEHHDITPLYRLESMCSKVKDGLHIVVGTDRLQSFNEHFPDYTLTPASDLRPTATFPYQHPVSTGGRTNTRTSPSVSVVVPFYNSGSTFLTTMKSLFRQSLQNFEVIIVDDCSNNAESLEMLQKFSQDHNDNRVKIIRHKQNRGLSAARNSGFRKAQAEFVFILDTDDMLEPTNLEKSMLFLSAQPNAGFVKGFTVGTFLIAHYCCLFH